MTQRNIAQLASVIRFNLGELGARNGHHEFEHLCRHLARARVYSNILPATGPVSAGGDGGRDFETFRTGVNFPLTAGSTYQQNTSLNRVAAFAVTLEKKIAPKIQRDIDNIIASGPVDEIIYFCEANVPVAKRQKLQKGARTKNVDLQVFDGQAISEMLTDKDTFWIAQEYLKIPADLMPRSVDDTDWYRELLGRWSDKQPIVVSHADFIEIKTGLRHATFHVDARQDLNAWLARMEMFLGCDLSRALQRNAEYEVIVATYRGKGDFHQKIPLVDSYFSDFGDFLGLADLQDAATLLVYAWGASLRQNYGGDPEALFCWRRELVAVLDQEMINALGPGRRSGLLQIRGYLEAMPAQVDATLDLINMTHYWSKLLDEAVHAPLFPITIFADHLSKQLAIFGPQPELIDLATRVDDLVANRGGQAEAGRKAFDRARVLLEHSHHLAAIKELHHARRRFFLGDRIVDALKVMLLLSDCYLQLGLAYAAKYYALSVAYVANSEQRHEITMLLPQALFSAVDAEDAAGNGIGLAGLLLWTMGAHAMYEQDPFDEARHPRVKENLGQMQALLGFLKRGDASLFENVKRIFDAWPTPISKGILDGCSETTKFWNTGNWDDAWSGLSDTLLDRPWGDIGVERVVRWEALGVSWSCQFENTFEVTPIAEQFIAELQLTQAAVAVLKVDIALMPITVKLSLTVAKKPKKIGISKPSYDGDLLSLQLTIPASDGAQGAAPATVHSLILVLAQCSVLRQDQFLSATRQFSVSACEQSFNLRSYRETYRQFVLPESFFDFARISKNGFCPEMPFSWKTIDEIGGSRGPGPTYDTEQAQVAIARRYASWIPYVRFTLRNMIAKPLSRAMLRQLHNEGMKDWQILMLVGNIVFSVRSPVDIDIARGMTDSQIIAAKEAIAVPETEETALESDDLSWDDFQVQRQIAIALLLNSWTLDDTSKLFTCSAMEQFLINRYRLYEDDTDHEDIFRWDEWPA